MTNNDVLRRLRYCFDFSDGNVVKLFKIGGLQVTRAEISSWLKKEEDEDYQNLSDRKLAIFLNGFINEKRGPSDGDQREPEKTLTNNIVFMKLKIALNLQAEEIVALIELAGFRMSKHELSAFFRKPGHKHHRECKDQILRNFLNGLTLKYRDQQQPDSADNTSSSAAAQPEVATNTEQKGDDSSKPAFDWGSIKKK